MSIDAILPTLAVSQQSERHSHGQKRQAPRQPNDKLNAEQKEALSFLKTYNELIGQFINVTV